MQVSNLEIDLCNYNYTFSYIKRDYQVFSEYVSNKSYYVIVKRLDTNTGWDDTLHVLSVHPQKSIVVDIGTSSENEKKVLVEVDFEIDQGEPINRLSNYNIIESPDPQQLTRKQFNELFNTDIIVLPRNLYAVGIRKGNVYLYNEYFADYYDIIYPIKHIVNVAISNNVLKEFYFIICAGDGFIEYHFPSERTIGRKFGENELQNTKHIILDNPNEYPIVHKDIYILAQATHKNISYTIDMIDRHYLYCNLYNNFRSFHKGVPFMNKINKIVYGCRKERATRFNFTNRRDIEMNPRQYFYSDAVPKDNMYCPDRWVDSTEMINYKYILDIDGNSSTWDATAWKLNSNSVILKSDSGWKQYFYNEYLPFKHYVPVADDFSDIQEKYKWCENNQDECLKMIENCKKLFQKIFRYHNVIDYTIEKIYEFNRLKPYILNDRRVFFCTDYNNPTKLDNQIIINKQISGNIYGIHNVFRKLNSTDIVIYMNTEYIDVHNFDLNKFIDIYLSIGKKIVFGAEKNLWPESLNGVRSKLNKLAPKDSIFKFLQPGFFCAEAGEMTKLFDERIYDQNNCPIAQEYFVGAFLSGKYSIELDYSQKLVMCAYQCNRNDLNKCISSGTQFILYNGGRW